MEIESKNIDFSDLILYFLIEKRLNIAEDEFSVRFNLKLLLNSLD